MAFSWQQTSVASGIMVLCATSLTGCVKETLADVPVIGEPTLAVVLDAEASAAQPAAGVPVGGAGAPATAEELMACAQKDLSQVHHSRLLKFPQDANQVPLFGQPGKTPDHVGLCCVGSGGLGYRVTARSGTVKTGYISCGTPHQVGLGDQELHEVELVLFPALHEPQWLAYSVHSK